MSHKRVIENWLDIKLDIKFDIKQIHVIEKSHCAYKTELYS